MQFYRDDSRPDIHSSKGNQWKIKAQGNWYKADYLGYEALAEIIVSGLLQFSNVPDYVHYFYEEISYEKQMFHGCGSRDFLKENQELVTLERLYRQFTGKSLANDIKDMEIGEKIVFVVEKIRKFTGIFDFGRYLTLMLELDAFFLNEDRHLHNIALIRNDSGEYETCPIFDNGAALLSDIQEYPLGTELDVCIERIEAKPFSRNFDYQMDAAEEIYGTQLKLWFQEKNVTEILKGFTDIYETAVLERIEELLRRQKRKYQYFW